MDYLEVPRLRLDRAAEHIRDFITEADAYLKTDPFGSTVEYFEEGGVKFVKLLFRVHREPPKRLGVIVGDCIHNLRAILDNIVWSLGAAFPPTDPKSRPDMLAFPVCKNEDDFKKALKNPKYSSISAFPAAAQDLIRALQPIWRDNSLPGPALYLGMLNDLWNMDKHRSPDLMGGTNHAVALRGYNLQQPASLAAGMAVLDGREFARGAVPPAGIPSDARVDLSVDVAFHVNGPAKGQIARHLLGAFYYFVRDDVIARFEPIFPKP